MVQRPTPKAGHAGWRASTEVAPARVRRSFAPILDEWPARRLVAVVVLSPVLLALLTGTAGGWAPRAAPGWTALVALVAVLSAAVLATYLPRPGAGRRLETGCTPCAAVAGLSVLGAAAMLSTSLHHLPTAGMALGIVAFGLTQRLTSPSSCEAPSSRPPAQSQ